MYVLALRGGGGVSNLKKKRYVTLEWPQMRTVVQQPTFNSDGDIAGGDVAIEVSRLVRDRWSRFEYDRRVVAEGWDSEWLDAARVISRGRGREVSGGQFRDDDLARGAARKNWLLDVWNVLQ